MTTLSFQESKREGNPSAKPRLLVFIVAYNAEASIASVLERIPDALLHAYNVEILVIDDSSRDNTFTVAESIRKAENVAFPLHVLYNPENQGYGGNQKIGYHFAITKGFDFVALVHGDGQYAPEELPRLVEPLRDGSADAVFGSRMMKEGRPLHGGMPLYKFIGNKLLTWLENRLLGTHLSEFHSGYRIYSIAALKKIPFQLNTDDFHFDTEIIIQWVRAGLRIRELPIPTYYGKEICHVNGMKYAFDVIWSVIQSRLNDINLLYDRKFDCRPDATGHAQYKLKLGFESPHALVLATVPTGARVIHLGCASGYFGQLLRERCQARVTGVDSEPLPPNVTLDDFVLHDLDAPNIPINFDKVDIILLLDVIENLKSPERFVDRLYEKIGLHPSVRLVVSSGNIAFFISRLLHVCGIFNYGKKGILDMTHTRLFTCTTLRRLFEQSGFSMTTRRYIPAPWPLVFGNGVFGRFMMGTHKLLCRIWPSLFAYQFLMEFRPRPNLNYLLQVAYVMTEQRANQISNNSLHP